nr:lactosylceramide 4-alpha-galactosyltransferase-like [Procambarus clarkii]
MPELYAEIGYCYNYTLFTTDGRTYLSLPAVVADYEDYFAPEAVMGVEGGEGEGGWRAAACTLQANTTTPPFPVTLPNFTASSSDKNIFFLETMCSSALNAKMTTLELAVVLQVSVSTDWPGINLSDALRLGVVCSVGGIYLDLDVWTMAPLPSGESWVGSERLDYLTNSAFKLPKDHWVCEEAIRELTEHFRGNVWAYNGPGVFQRVVRKACNIQNIADIHNCKDLVILAPSTFYPIYWSHWEEFFVSGGGSSKTWPQNTVAIHLWNKLSKGAPLHPGDGSIVDKTSQKNCPKIFNTVTQIKKFRDNLQTRKMHNISSKHNHVA